MDIFEALRHDHDIQRELIRRLIKTHGDTQERDKLFAQLKQELVAHATAEERIFYMPLMQNDFTQGKCRHSIAEHHEIDELIEALETTPYSSPQWLVKAKQLEEKVEHHLSEEEHEVFQMAGKTITQKAKQGMAGMYHREMDTQRKTA
ncbi:DNA nickase [Thalassocella blandensis]|nr:DNA nickase [Thalassocella blandensis]